MMRAVGVAPSINNTLSPPQSVRTRTFKKMERARGTRYILFVVSTAFTASPPARKENAFHYPFDRRICHKRTLSVSCLTDGIMRGSNARLREPALRNVGERKPKGSGAATGRVKRRHPLRCLPTRARRRANHDSTAFAVGAPQSGSLKNGVATTPLRIRTADSIGPAKRVWISFGR